MVSWEFLSPLWARPMISAKYSPDLVWAGLTPEPFTCPSVTSYPAEEEGFRGSQSGTERRLPPGAQHVLDEI